MSDIYAQATFKISAAKLSQLPQTAGREVAFAGRSNAGKSSAINTITRIKRLARTSKTPGRTQLINLFHLDGERYLVDLPGYGYAKVNAAVKQRWQETMEEYLTTREALVGLILLMDVRHPLKESDQHMLHWCGDAQMPVHILLTKSDKLKRGVAKRSLLDVSAAIKEYDSDISVQLFSSLKRTGIEEVVHVLDKWLQISK